MGKDECLNADWRTIGYEDGARGMPAGKIGERRTDCAKYGVKPDLSAYLAGRTQGLNEYCKLENGYRVGAAGGQYGGVCPPRLEGAFLAGFNVGHQLFSLQAALRSVEAEIGSRHHELDRIKKQVEDKSVALVAEETTTKQRLKLLADIKELSERRARVKHEIAILSRERDARAAELNAFRDSHPGGLPMPST